jgi:hypothetical protein
VGARREEAAAASAGAAATAGATAAGAAAAGAAATAGATATGAAAAAASAAAAAAVPPIEYIKQGPSLLFQYEGTQPDLFTPAASSQQSIIGDSDDSEDSGDGDGLEMSSVQMVAAHRRERVKLTARLARQRRLLAVNTTLRRQRILQHIRLQSVCRSQLLDVCITSARLRVVTRDLRHIDSGVAETDDEATDDVELLL